MIRKHARANMEESTGAGSLLRLSQVWLAACLPENPGGRTMGDFQAPWVAARKASDYRNLDGLDINTSCKSALARSYPHRAASGAIKRSCKIALHTRRIPAPVAGERIPKRCAMLTLIIRSANSWHNYSGMRISWKPSLNCRCSDDRPAEAQLDAYSDPFLIFL